MSNPLLWLHYVIHRALLNTMDTHSRPCFLFQGRAYVRRNGQDLSTLLGYLESPFLNFLGTTFRDNSVERNKRYRVRVP